MDIVTIIIIVYAILFLVVNIAGLIYLKKCVNPSDREMQRRLRRARKYFV